MQLVPAVEPSPLASVLQLPPATLWLAVPRTCAKTACHAGPVDTATKNHATHAYVESVLGSVLMVLQASSAASAEAIPR